MSETEPHNETPYVEVEPGETCGLCDQPIELGFMVVDDDGYHYCEECWQP